MKLLSGLWLVLLMAVATGVKSQHMTDKVAIGFQIGPSLWVNDMNDRRVGAGLLAFARFGIDDHFSVGILGGIEALRAGQFPLDPPDLNVDFLSVTPVILAGKVWIHLSPGKIFSPYLYTGFGVGFYKRKDGIGKGYPSEAYSSSSTLYIPLGAGFESFITKNTAISFELGYCVLSANTDTYESGKSDGMSTAKVGLSFFWGTNEDDDDDNDGVSNRQEAELGLDRTNPDTDMDGIADGDELKTYRTDPRLADSDGDGLNDGDEVWRFRTDPVRPDTDRDNVSDGEEVSQYNTDPLKADTDKDGLTDGEEIKTYRTDPLKPDTDDDGLPDPNELYGYKSNPLLSDSDGGGIPDGIEVKRGTSPVLAADDVPRQVKPEPLPPAVGEVLPVGEIKFRANSSDVSEISELALMRLLDLMTKDLDVAIEVRGYTDDRGSRAKNIRLSYQRAYAVKRWLEGRGIRPERIEAKGFGPENPLVPNTNEQNREMNRRIEIIRSK
ncbi:MAG: OmpA family protein [Ignavibacteriae bacterium]|nr:OmpA family protein [Ignavibacteriota bacterium]